MQCAKFPVKKLLRPVSHGPGLPFVVLEWGAYLPG